MNSKKLLAIVIYVILSLSLSQAGVLTVLHGTKGQADRELKILEKSFKDINFTIAAKNEHLENHYYNQFKDKNLDLLNFYRIYDKEGMRALLLKNPDFGAYTPFNFLAFKKLDSMEGGDTTWYGYLDAETMLNIIGEKDEASRKTFKKMLSRVDRLVMEKMKPTVTKKLEFSKPLPEKPLLKMIKKIEDTDDIEAFVETFIMEYDSLFTKNHFVIAGFLDLKFEYDDLDLEFDKYDAYWISSLCHFKFSNAVFNHGEPQAGVFAPCSIYFYIPKGSNELHVGYATVENWILTTGIKDEAQLLYMKKVADEVRETFVALGFTEEGEADSKSAVRSESKGDLAAEISQIKAMVEALTKEVKALRKELAASPKKEIKKDEPSAALLPKKQFNTPRMVIGGPAPKELTAYYAANPQELKTLVEKLKAAGFEILSVTDILDGKRVVTVTNEKLKSTNTFMAALNILVDGTDEIRVQNPSYLGAAYLGDRFSYGQFSDVLKALQSALGDMYATEDVLAFSKLKDFSFKPGMSKFSDIVELEDGDDLAEKLKNEKTAKYIAYTLKLPNGAILVGHKMRPRVNKFLNKINEGKNAQLLPYQSMIKDRLAYMLDPTYYLALSLPLLSMEEFMKIATAPDEIGKSIGRAYR